MHPGNNQLALLLLASWYLVCVGMAAHAVLGIARTAATRLPVRSEPDGFYLPLFLFDYTITLHKYSGRGRKALKVAILAASGLLTAGGAAFLFYAQTKLNSGWTGNWWAIGLHVAGWVALTTYAIYRGVSRANKAPGRGR